MYLNSQQRPSPPFPPARYLSCPVALSRSPGSLEGTDGEAGWAGRSGTWPGVPGSLARAGLQELRHKSHQHSCHLQQPGGPRRACLHARTRTPAAEELASLASAAPFVKRSSPRHGWLSIVDILQSPSPSPQPRPPAPSHSPDPHRKPRPPDRTMGLACPYRYR